MRQLRTLILLVSLLLLVLPTLAQDSTDTVVYDAEIHMRGNEANWESTAQVLDGQVVRIDDSRSVLAVPSQEFVELFVVSDSENGLMAFREQFEGLVRSLMAESMHENCEDCDVDFENSIWLLGEFSGTTATVGATNLNELFIEFAAILADETLPLDTIFVFDTTADFDYTISVTIGDKDAEVTKQGAYLDCEGTACDHFGRMFDANWQWTTDPTELRRFVLWSEVSHYGSLLELSDAVTGNTRYESPVYVVTNADAATGLVAQESQTEVSSDNIVHGWPEAWGDCGDGQLMVWTKSDQVQRVSVLNPDGSYVDGNRLFEAEQAICIYQFHGTLLVGWTVFANESAATTVTVSMAAGNLQDTSGNPVTADTLTEQGVQDVLNN